MARQKKSLSAAVSKEIKSKFDLNAFKNKKGLDKNIKFKDQEWIPLSKAFQDVTSVPGIPMGHIVLLRGHSDTGKTTAMIEAAVSAQKRDILPVFIITEMKWNWEHAIQMGLDINITRDDSGEIIDYEGNFIYVDRETINSIEDVAGFILDLMDEQKKVIYLMIYYSYGIVLVLYLVKCHLNQIKIIMSGMLVLCQPNLVIM